MSKIRDEIKDEMSNDVAVVRKFTTDLVHLRKKLLTNGIGGLTMREILFRGKHIFDGGWVYGFAYKQYSAAKVEEWYIRAFETDYLVVPETVCQFTGLYDKNGRKIFEGDIVERGGRIWRVKYGDNYGKFMMTTYTEKGVSWGRDFDTIPPDWCEVIGNIYDNPELLEVKQNEM